MSEITPSEFKIVQSYGGLKEAYFELDSASAADTIDFSDYEVASDDVKIATLQNQLTGTVIPVLLCATDSTVTVGSGPSATLCMGTIKFRDY